TVEDTGRIVEMQLRKKVFRCNAATYACESQDTIVRSTERQLKDGPPWVSRSPDRKWDVFVYDYNLYARPAELTNNELIAKRDSILAAANETAQRTGRDSTGTDSTAQRARPPANADSVALPAGSIQLTTDGVAQWAYDNDMTEIFSVRGGGKIPRWKPKRAPAVWSPDSRRFALSRLDYRNMRRYPIYSSTGNQPEDRSYYYAAPGDSVYP